MKSDIKHARERGLRASVAGKRARQARAGRIRASRRMEEITVEIEATNTLTWDGGEIVVTVPTGASREEIEAAIVRHLMTNDRGLDWDWAEPEVQDWEVVEDEQAE
jgi:hypothetical protein